VLGVCIMSGPTPIQWTDRTWNPVRGCSRVSQGCVNCYAEKIAARFSRAGQPFEGFARPRSGGQWTGKVALVPELLDAPLQWRKPCRIFVNSMSDLFHEGLTDEAIAAVFGVMASAPQHTFQVLTKRPANMKRFFDQGDPVGSFLAAADRAGVAVRLIDSRKDWLLGDPLPNVWLGVSVEDQATADERIPLLLQTPAAVRFVSYEPAIGEIDFQCIEWQRVNGSDYFDSLSKQRHPFDDVGLNGAALDWVIVGGESGPGARPFDVAWARETIRQCRKAGVACFVKQMGSFVRERNDMLSAEPDPPDPSYWPEPDCGWDDGYGGNIQRDLDGYRDGYQGAPIRIRLKDRKGGDPAEWPEDLRVREFPR
jgi:protein gp37